MSNVEAITQGLIDATVIGIVRLPDPETLLAAVSAAFAGGVRAIEITMTTPGALEVISKIHRRFGPELLLGVGSVTDAETARAAVAKGPRTSVTSTKNDAGQAR